VELVKGLIRDSQAKGRTTSETRTAGTQKEAGRPSSDRECCRCHKMGHFSRECPTREKPVSAIEDIAEHIVQLVVEMRESNE